MRSPRLMIAMLVLATLLVDCAVAVACHQSHNGRPPFLLLEVALIGLMLSQVSLMAIWLAVGRPSGPWRLLGMLGVLLAWAHVLEEAGGVRMTASLPYLGILTASITGPLLIARVCGLRVTPPSDTSSFEGPAAGPRRFQFSILYLLGWMTAWGIALGTFNYLVPFRDLTRGPTWHLSDLLMLLGLAAISIAALWAVLGARRPRPYVAGAILLSILLAFAVMLTEPSGRESLLWLYLPTTLWVIGSLAVFRVAGYRLRRRRANDHRMREPAQAEQAPV